jgi:hypothetical protein
MSIRQMIAAHVLALHHGAFDAALSPQVVGEGRADDVMVEWSLLVYS